MARSGSLAPWTERQVYEGTVSHSLSPVVTPHAAPQGDHPRGATRRQVAGGKSDEDSNTQTIAKSAGRRPNLEQQRSQEPSRQRGAEQAADEPNPTRIVPSRKTIRWMVGAVGAKRHAHADFARPLAGREADDRVDPEAHNSSAMIAKAVMIVTLKRWLTTDLSTSP